MPLIETSHDFTRRAQEELIAAEKEWDKTHALEVKKAVRRIN